MKSIKLGLKVVMVLFLLIYIFLIVKLANGLILNIQVYSNIQLVPMMFWFFIVLVFINLLIADTGFIKIGAVMGIVSAVFLLAFQIITVTSSFDSINSDKYDLILETVGPSYSRTVTIYKKDSLFFSKLVGSDRIADYYDITYEIVGDTFIITKCTENSCVTEEIDLE